jgi:hypothetical protein
VRWQAVSMSTDAAVVVPCSVPAQTVLIADDGSVVLWIDGVLLLPVGAVIELTGGTASATVTQVRLRGAAPGATPLLVLDVNLVQSGGNDGSRS